MTPDPWQTALMASQERQVLLLCARQTGKSFTAAAIAALKAVLEPGSLILILSPSERQSAEMLNDKVKRLLTPIVRSQKNRKPLARLEREAMLSLTFENGSRIVALPQNQTGVVGFSSVSLLLIDEAARVGEDLYRAVRPMLAISQGRLIVLSTPLGRRGWFYEEWTGGEGFHRIRITAGMCPRISPVFLASERRSLGERWYRQEYECSFEENIGSVFLQEDIQAAVVEMEPLDL